MMTWLQDRPLLFRVSARNLNSEGFGNGGVGQGIAVNAPFAPVNNFQVTSVEKDSVLLGWETPKFGYVTSYRVKVCVADDYCSGGRYMVDNKCSPLCACLADGTPSCADGTEADCNCVAPNTDAKCEFNSDCTGDGVCLRVCGCHDCTSVTRPAGPFTGQLFYNDVGAEYIYDGEEWISTGKNNWRLVAQLPVRMSTFKIRNATTVILGKERTGPLQQGLRHDFSIEARNLNALGYGSRSVSRGAMPSFLPPTPIQVFAINPQADSCVVLWCRGLDGPQYGPTHFYRIQGIRTATGAKYFDEQVIGVTTALCMSVVVNKLWPGTKYSFKVFAGNLAGLDDLGGGNNTVTTLPYPAGIGLSRVDTSNDCGGLNRPGCRVTMYWDAIPNQNEIEYKVKMRLYYSGPSNNNPWVVKATDVRGNMVEITDLAVADTRYEVCIQGRIVGGEYHPTCTLEDQIVITSAPSYAVVEFRVDNMTASELRLSWRVFDQYDDVILRDTWYALEESQDAFAPDAKGLQDSVQIRTIHHATSTECYYDSRHLCIYTTITGLAPGRQVHYRVRARNANAEGLSSMAAYLTTAPFARIPSAHNLRVASVTDTSVLMEWQRPPGMIGTSLVWSEITWEPNGKVRVDGAPLRIGYTEALKTLDGACVEGYCWYNATGLTTDRIYTFHIRLNNNHETGYEAGVSIKASPVGVPDAPSQAFIAAVTSESIELRWRPPHGVPYVGLPGVREAIKYKLRCRLMPGYAASDEASVCNNATFFKDSGVELEASEQVRTGVSPVEHAYVATIQGLEAGIGYRVQVCSGGLNVGFGDRYFEDGCGPFVEAVTSGPPEPVMLSSPGVYQTSVSLSWTSASVGSGEAGSAKELGWNFLEGMDVNGYTLECPGGATIKQLKDLCWARPDCAGFNTYGCLKSHIPHFWRRTHEGRERKEWLLMTEHASLLSRQAATGSSAASAQMASRAADLLAAAAAPQALTAAALAATSAAAAAKAADAADAADSHLTSPPLQTHANGTCCIDDPIFNEIGTMTYAGWTDMPGCEKAWSDLPPQRAACGCRCIGTWYKTIRYRVQYQRNPSAAFINVAGAEDLIGLTHLVTGLEAGRQYAFRVFAQGLNALGPDLSGSNTLYARPLGVPAEPAAASLVKTFRSGEGAVVGTATLSWLVEQQASLDELVTAYQIQISLDGSTFSNSLSYLLGGTQYSVGLAQVAASPSKLAPDSDIVIAQASEGQLQITVVVENLALGQTYWLRVVARNHNLAGYSLSPPSNTIRVLMSGAPPPVLNLEAALVSSCTQESCGCACCGQGGTNTCDGIADVTIQWNNPSGAFDISAFKIAASLNGHVVSEGFKSPTPEGVGDGSYTLAVDGHMVLRDITETYVIKGLLLHRTYLISVTARNENTEGYKYPAQMEVMPAEKPWVSVQETLRAVRVTRTSVTLEWRPVTSQPVSFYKVDSDVSPAFAASAADSFFGEFAHQSSEDADYRMRVIVTELTPEQPYYFVVTPRNLNIGSASGASAAFVLGYRGCPGAVQDLAVTPLAPSALYASLRAFRLTWTASTTSERVLAYRIWHSSFSLGEQGAYERIADVDAAQAGAMEHHVDGFAASQSPHSFLVTPILAHCAVIGPITPRALPLIPELARVQSVTSKTATVHWRSPGCPDACQPLSAFVVSVGNCATSASVHAHAPVMLDCQLAQSEETSPVDADACASDGWCHHTVHGLAHGRPVRIRLQAWGEGYREPGANVTLVAVPSRPAQRAPSSLTLEWKQNAASDSSGASVRLMWSAPLLEPLDERVDRYKIGYWLVSDKACWALPPRPYPCFSYQESGVVELASAATVTGLRPDVKYAFKVFAGNLNGFEVVGSDVLTPVASSHMPGPVERLSAVSLSDSSLMLSWVNPSHPTPRKLLIKLTDLDCVRDETDKGAGASSVASSCVRSWQESCSLGTCAAAPSFCVGTPVAPRPV